MNAIIDQVVDSYIGVTTGTDRIAQWSSQQNSGHSSEDSAGDTVWKTVM